ncbi:MAG TPA: hypothetical protein VGN83_16780 [Falsiroseomonas sp.]|nr:hypothetical protein [Falsiroseomonas sp.]
MLHAHAPNRENCDAMQERVMRQNFVVAKLRQDGFPGEVQAARRMLRMLEAELAAVKRRCEPRRTT